MHGAAALVGRQQVARRHVGRRRHVVLLTGQDRQARGPIRKTRAAQSGAFDGDAHHAARPSTRLQLAPPKPNELLITRLTRARRPSRTYWLLNAGSTWRVCGLPGRKSCRMPRAQNTASTTPEAPSVCPAKPLVELHGVAAPNKSNMARSSAASPTRVAVPWRLT